jgi:DNA transformation protein
MKKSEFLEYVLDCLSPLGTITSRAMFGGYGIYKDGLIFAVIIKDELYFKANKNTEEFYKSHDSLPFTYQGKKGPVKMNYWKVDTDHLKAWFDVANKAALNSKI